MRVLALGEKELSEDYRLSIRGQLDALSPSLLLTDLAPGWNLMVAEEARRRSIPLMGAFPHEEVLGKRAYREARRKVLRHVKTKVIFNETFFTYLKNPKPYVEWLLKNTDTVLACVDMENNSLAHSILKVMREREKLIFNVLT